MLAVEVEAMKERPQADEDRAAKVASRCVTRTSGWKARQKVRVEGLVTIHETSKSLNDDDSFELFKGTLASCPSLIQVQRRKMKTLLRVRAPMIVSCHGSSHFNLISSGKGVDFTKDIVMIDETVALLKHEQFHDGSKRTYCKDSINKTRKDVITFAIEIQSRQSALSDFNDQPLALALSRPHGGTFQVTCGGVRCSSAHTSFQREKMFVKSSE